MTLKLPGLPGPRTAKPRSRLGKWMMAGSTDSHDHSKSPWYKVLWLTGVDYFSTLSYQPGIALFAAGILSPIATVILILVTLFCAVPTYSKVAERSHAGQGSVAILENLLSSWWSKLTVLVLLGFAITDFIITITLSASDAALHIVENSLLHHIVGNHQTLIAVLLITGLTIIFLKGFKEAIQLAMAIAIPFMVINAIVLGVATSHILNQPDLVWNWQGAVSGQGSFAGALLAAAIVFPRLALGMSGFETGVSVMPLVDGGRNDKDHQGRIRATKKMLLTAGVIMSVYLMFSSLVTTFLIPEDLYHKKEIEGRALSYITHSLMGEAWGSVYDLSTILILWFAGASAVAALINLISRYLPRFGMAPRWIAYRRPLVIAIYIVSVAIVLFFDADVDAQAGAYATGVLAVMFSASAAMMIAYWKERHEDAYRKRLWAGFFMIVSVVFAFTLIDNIILRPDGLMIASLFILAILILSALSRWQRALELRVEEISFIDEESMDLWQRLRGKKVHLAPVRTVTESHLRQKTKELEKYYNFEGPLAFLNVQLLDNRSEFLSAPKVRVESIGSNYIITVTHATALANTIAYLSELIDPISLYLGLTGGNLMTQSLRYLLWGEGETGLLVYRILLRYWEWTPERDVQPQIFLMSDSTT